MKKIILCSAFIAVLFSCSKEEEIISNPTSASKKSFVDFQKKGYQGQLQYLNARYSTFDFSIKNNLKNTINNEKYDWKYFDSLYNESLNISEKQYLAYIILAKKDLLSDFKNNPDQQKNDVIEKYTNILIDTEYVGYCLLYNSLETLQKSKFNKKDLSKQKQDILSYSSRINFSENASRNLSTKDSKANMYITKINENQEYLEMIKKEIMK